MKAKAVDVLAKQWVLLEWTAGKAREVGRFARWIEAQGEAKKIGCPLYSIEDATSWDRVNEERA